jgi:RNA polymerase sigma factor (sigma-70 family)
MTEPTSDVWLEGVVQRNDRDLKRYLAQRIGNRAEVEDLSQEIYLRLLRIERKDLIRSPEALLFRVASNAVYEWRLLARNRLPHSPTDLEDLESREREPSEDIWRTELAHALTAALERLSPRCRAAVLLHRREQLTYSEVGLQLGISVAMVKKYLSQGVALCRGHLRTLLEGAEDQGDR